MTEAICPSCAGPMPAGHTVACSRACRQRLSRASGKRYYTGTCRVCGRTWPTNRQNATICSDACRSVDYTTPTFTQAVLPIYSQRSSLADAIETGNAATAIQLLRKRTDTVGDCWLWNRQTKDGYGVLKYRTGGGRRLTKFAHRVVAELTYGNTDHMPVHHKCAHRACINPSHLQYVTPAENTAEMLERSSYLRRIADLEAALSAADPSHPLLTPASG